MTRQELNTIKFIAETMEVSVDVALEENDTFSVKVELHQFVADFNKTLNRLAYYRIRRSQEMY